MEDFKKNYEIIEELNEVISIIKKKNNNNKYILKKIYINNKEEMDNVENEAKILKSLDHKNIVKYLESFKEKRFFYIIMEYCENSDLKKYIEKYKNKNQFIDQNLICSIVLDICSGIKEIHENDIIHRDLKPENIFISHDNTFKIGDFGISKKLNRTKHAKTKGIGTSYYMVPELL